MRSSLVCLAFAVFYSIVFVWDIGNDPDGWTAAWGVLAFVNWILFVIDEIEYRIKKLLDESKNR